jgi:hypothetical protein
VVLLLGLVLVTSADRLSGAPMLAVLCGGLLIGRLGTEVGLGRWRQLSRDEQTRLGAAERWRTSFQQLAAALLRLVGVAGSSLGGLISWVRERRAASARAKESTKRWVRPEPEANPTEIPPSDTPDALTDQPDGTETEGDGTETGAGSGREPTLATESASEAVADAGADDTDVVIVESFTEIEQLIEQAAGSAADADAGPLEMAGEEGDDATHGPQPASP